MTDTGVYPTSMTIMRTIHQWQEEELLRFDKLYAEAIAKKEKVVKEMGFDLDDADKLETEMLLRTQYCGFQAKLKCKGSPAANMLKK